MIDVPTKQDELVERRVDWLTLQLSAAKTPFQRRLYFRKLKAAIASRSPAQVERMERERGLR